MGGSAVFGQSDPNSVALIENPRTFDFRGRYIVESRLESNIACNNQFMEEKLKSLVGKKIDVSCTSAVGFTGEVLEVENGILSLRDDEDKTLYISIEKIAAVNVVSDNHLRPGFVA